MTGDRWDSFKALKSHLQADKPLFSGLSAFFLNVQLPWKHSHGNLGGIDLRPVPRRSFDEFRTKTATLGRCLTRRSPYRRGIHLFGRIKDKIRMEDFIHVLRTKSDRGTGHLIYG